jgi:hypothetical protein
VSQVLYSRIHAMWSAKGHETVWGRREIGELVHKEVVGSYKNFDDNGPGWPIRLAQCGAQHM